MSEMLVTVAEIAWTLYRRGQYHRYVGTADVLADTTRHQWEETRPDWRGRYWRLMLEANRTTLEPLNVTEEEHRPKVNSCLITWLFAERLSTLHNESSGPRDVWRSASTSLSHL